MAPHLTMGISIVMAIVLPAMVSSDAILDVRILSFRNQGNRLDNGDCCQGREVNDVCRSLCLSLLRICITDTNMTSETIDDNSLEICKYGIYVTEPTFGGVRDGHPRNSNLNVAFRFPYPWKGEFGIIMEAWHRTTNFDNATFVGGFPARLISRVALNKVLGIHDGWKKEKDTSSGDHPSIFEYVMQVQCQTAFYGDNCSEVRCRWWRDIGKWLTSGGSMWGTTDDDKESRFAALASWKDNIGPMLSGSLTSLKDMAAKIGKFIDFLTTVKTLFGFFGIR